MLTRNPSAVQIGLTATPRKLDVAEESREALADAQVSADNLAHFGEPVYEYDMSQGIEDGYLAACEIVRRDVFFDDKAQPERESGLDQNDFRDKTLRDADTGEPMGWITTRARYDASAFEDRLLLLDRVAEMRRDLFRHLLATGGPERLHREIALPEFVSAARSAGSNINETSGRRATEHPAAHTPPMRSLTAPRPGMKK